MPDSDSEPTSGSHLATEAEPSVGDNIVKVIQKVALKSVVWIAIYTLGYFDFSVAWLATPLLLSVMRSQWKRERDAKLSAARHAALTNEKVMIESRIRVEDLPTWVFFPDKERAEWMNSITKQLWPNVGHYTRKIIVESVEPAVKSALEGYGLSGFRFERVVLGQIPPRITGIKVYDKNVSRKEIIMDADIVFASDCDIKFALGPKIKAKIMDFSLRGLVRIVFKPIVNEIPLIGGVQVYFLTPPDIDFDLGGVANAFDVPGLSNIIRKIVLEQIGYFMVLPHKFTMPLIESVDNAVLRCPDSAGVLRVRLHGASELMKKDVGLMGTGKSDPYATITVGAKTVETKRINNTVNPKWNHVAEFPIEVVKGQQLTLEVFDHDDPGDDEFLGRATVQTSVVAARGKIDGMWVELEDVKSGRAQMSLEWREVSLDSPLLRASSAEDRELAKCLLHVYVDSAKEVYAKGGDKPSPMAQIRVGQDVQQTFPQYFTTDPVFEQGFVFLVVNPDADDLTVKILDTKNKDKEVASAVIRVSDIIKKPGMNFEKQPVTLKGNSSGQAALVLSCSVRSLKPAGKSSQIMEEPKQEQKPPVAANQDLTKPVEESQPTKETAVPASEQASESEGPSAIAAQSDTSQDQEEPATPDRPMEDLLMPVKSMGVRKRENAAPAEGNCGRIKMRLDYNQDREELKIFVNRAVGLPGAHLEDPPDPYAKLYLLPEKSKKSKRKTEVVKDTTEPVYDEEFEYDDLPPARMMTMQLEVTIVDKKTRLFARNAVMGRAVIELGDVAEAGHKEDWFDLFEYDSDSD